MRRAYATFIWAKVVALLNGFLLGDSEPRLGVFSTRRFGKSFM